MAEQVQQDYGQQLIIGSQIWRFRWFLVYLYATALILSIIAAVIIAIVTKGVYPGIIPAPLLLAMKPIVKEKHASYQIIQFSLWQLHLLLPGKRGGFTPKYY